ncbi:MAG TPA: anti-sigma factor, partial [Gemmatimonadales bacterium]|nr:anti-sigma factor [Gemmatimonadales bacterium]
MSHDHAVTLLAAYADDELPPEGRREVEAHLAECVECVQELRVQTALRLRLREEESALEPPDTLMRLEAYLAHLGRSASEQRASAVDIGPGKRPVLRHPLVAWSGWLVAA